jgi:hypothetical protein
MKLNVGGIDRILRVVLGAGLVAATGLGLLPAWGWIGIVPLATGVVGYCPFYPMLGVSTKS